MEKTIKVMLSNRHAHVSKETADILFGVDGLTIGGKTADKDSVGKADGVISIEGPKGKIDGVRILLHFRKKDQVEILQSDCFMLGVKAPIRMSGKLEGSAELKLIGPKGEVVRQCGIVAARHMHILPEDAERYGIHEGQSVLVHAGSGVRSLTFDNVEVEYNLAVPDLGSVMHIDFEEGNAAGIKNGDMLTIIA